MTAVRSSPLCCMDHGTSLSVESAQKRALEGVSGVDGEEIVSLRTARGRVTTSTILAEHALPPFDQSAMDGYTVRTSDFTNGLSTFPVVARQAAGPDGCAAVTGAPAAVRIFTGAVIPMGFDAVVMQEDCRPLTGTVNVLRRPIRGEHIRISGDDVAAGDVIVEARTLIDARHVAMLAAAGAASIRVRRRVRIGVLSTGNELREPNEHLAPGEIHDSNRAMLLSLLESASVDAIDLGRIADNRDVIVKTFEAAAGDFDVIISTGGVSVGEEDHVRAGVMAAGGALEQLNAAIKPGKPASVGRLGATNLIGLPGNPVAALVTFLWFARPMVLRRMGLTPTEPSSFAAVAGFDEIRKPGRDEFIPVVIAGHENDGRVLIDKHRRAGPARLSSLLGADGFARIPRHMSAIAPGDRLYFYPFTPGFSL